MKIMKKKILSMVALLSATVAVMAQSVKCPDNNHPHAINLGLPSGIKWACCNVGAKMPSGYGSYFTWSNNDIAYDNWGGSWRMPTKAQFEELRDNSRVVPATMNGINGCKFIGSNGGSIFIPLAGYDDADDSWDEDVKYVGEEGFYWTKSAYSKEGDEALFMSIDPIEVNEIERDDVRIQLWKRIDGLSIRPVCK